MKPQELRIGDYVRLRESGEIVRVCFLTEINIGVWRMIELNLTMMTCSASDIEPVPISEVYDRLPYICSLEWADKAAHKGVYLYRGVLLTALHELQNIHYAMTGEEIEIEP